MVEHSVVLSSSVFEALESETKSRTMHRFGLQVRAAFQGRKLHMRFSIISWLWMVLFSIFERS